MFRLVFLLFIAVHSHAHQSKENFLRLDYDSDSKQLYYEAQIETRNFETLFDLDDNGNAIVSYKELRRHQKSLVAYVNENMLFDLNGTSQSSQTESILFHRLQDQTYMQIKALLPLVSLKALCIEHRLFLDLDKEQKLFVHLNEPNVDVILSDDKREHCFKENVLSLWERFLLFTREGVHHIISGYDHLLFLLMLILPLTVLSYASRREEVISFLKVITAFSIAHSITLLLSATHTYQPSPLFIESAIAVSIMIVALLNALKRFAKVDYKIAFAFGLLHGFGFANVLSMGGVSGIAEFSIALLGFNLGVEIGQLMIVILMLAVLYLLMRSPHYIKIVHLASLASFILASYWLLERLKLIPFG